MTNPTNRTNTMPLPMPSPAEWTTHATVVLLFARILDDLGAFFDTKGAIDYFAKPKNWSGEYERWLALGAPIERAVLRRHTGYLLNGDATADCGCGGEPNKTCGGLECQNWRA
jgi:hypothetical protein